MTQHYADLHLHTHYSDGWKSPEEVVVEAARRGLQVIAITDHDNMRGYLQAEETANEQGIDLIPAVEMTTYWSEDGWSASVDLLAYGIDPRNTAFQDTLRGMLKDTSERVQTCCEHLTAAGYPVTLDDVREVNDLFPGVAPLIFALVDKGYVADFGAGLDLFRVAWQEVRPPALHIEKAIATVHAAGGITVLAHPTRIPRNEGLLSMEQLRSLVDTGLDGVEVCHPNLDENARKHYRWLARNLNLLMTGGSDEHAFGGNFRRMGTEPVTEEMVERLRERLNDLIAD